MSHPRPLPLLIGFLLAALLLVAAPTEAFACSAGASEPETGLVLFIGTVVRTSPPDTLDGLGYTKEITFDIESVGGGHAEQTETVTGWFGGPCGRQEELQEGERYLVWSTADRDLWSAQAIGSDPPPDGYVWSRPDSSGWFASHWKAALVVGLITVTLTISFAARRRRRALRASV